MINIGQTSKKNVIMATRRKPKTRKVQRGLCTALTILSLTSIPHMKELEKIISQPQISYEIPEEPLIFSGNEQKVIQFPLIPTIESHPKLEQYRGLIEEKAEKYGFDSDYIARIMWQESRGNPNAVSRAGAIGLVQLMPKNIDRYNVDNPNNPEENLEAGLKHLRWLTDKFGGNLKQGLAAYNAGQRHVVEALKPKSRRLEKTPLYGGKFTKYTYHNYKLRTENLHSETRNYVNIIMGDEK